jgi:predicted helicase
MQINEYLKQVKSRFSTGISTEHSYRADLQNLLNKMVKGITVTNEPKRQKCGAPDYIIQKKEVPLGYIEAKDIGIDLNRIEKSDQMKRYLSSLDNLILTDYLEFRFYKYGKKVKEIKIASIENGKIKTHTDFFESFSTHILDFCEFKGQTIKSAEKLAKMMAQKARMMEEVLFNAVKEEDENNTLQNQLKAFRQILIHDLDEKTFSDIYAQTITYGLFSARLHDKTLEDFSRQEARDLIPKSNPFLRNLFDYISGAQLDDRVVWIVDDLADILRAADLKSILADFGKTTGQNDPFLHFYETFLAEYDPKLRRSRGVYYTPEPVVNFIVRAVDDILEEEFNLPQGLADISKVKIKKVVEGTAVSKGKNKGTDIFEEVEVHKVQILDPATGTGTFLSETIKQIYQKFKGQEGLWSSYVEDHLIPRINGFEILMASYTMCHLKIEMLLRETGYKPKDEKNQKRLKVFLTNSLEEAHPNTGTLFASWLSKEATEANHVKRDTPLMVVIGNPPYSGESANKGEWIMGLMEDYKKEPGGKEKLKEKNSKWINDDYVKFLRYGQHFIEKNGEGILAYINPHSFLDNPTFRGMRWNLLKTYDKIYTIDLHGNSKKKEICPDGTADINIFDIQQGVSINIFIKTGKKKTNELGKFFHFDIFGKREMKYNFLSKNSLKTVPYKKLPNLAPNYFFMEKDFSLKKIYDKGFNIKKLFSLSGVGICSKRDKIAFQKDKKALLNVLKDFKKLSEADLKIKYKIKSESRDQKVCFAKQNVLDFGIKENYITKINYRPFDYKWTYYTNKVCGFIAYPVYNIMKHFLNGNNVGLITNRQCQTENYQHTFITNTINDLHITETANANPYTFPLYLYPETNGQQNIGQTTARTPNLNQEIVNQIAEKINLTFTNEKEETKSTFAPIDILDYIYAILHSPTYREKYKEFLKIDFPRIPFPKNTKTFWQLVKFGGELRTIHLLENPIVKKYVTSYPVSGSNIVEKPEYKDGKVFINKEQYFDKVPEIAWSFYIGGYQPAQKWLKYRKGKELSVENIFHYQKIIVALTETDRIMKEIGKAAEF